MRIDSHHHIWDLSVRDQDWITGDAMQPIRRNFSMGDLREAIAGHGIEKTVLVQTVTDYAETPELLALAESDSLIAGVVGWLKIDAPDAIEHLRGYLDLPGSKYLKSIRDIAQDHPDPNYLGKAETIANVRKLGEFGIAYDLLSKTRELAGAVALVKACPDVQFIMDHISKPYTCNFSKCALQSFWISYRSEVARLESSRFQTICRSFARDIYTTTANVWIRLACCHIRWNIWPSHQFGTAIDPWA